MSLDITHILNDWPYEPGQVTARRIRGADGQEKIQLRLDLGLLQMETTGRPDGSRPHGHETLLDYHQAQLQQHRERHGSGEGFTLDEDACELLRHESLMYYHRYLAEFILEDYEAVERDTKRNLTLMDFCAAYATHDTDRFILEQYRPYVLMMLTRARARLAMAQSRMKAARLIISEGIERIAAFYRRMGQDELALSASEISILKGMAKEVESQIPIDPVQRIRQDLAKAIHEERYEDAASLRDQLNQFSQSPQQQPEQQG